MNQKSGGIVLTLFFLAAIPACIYPIYDSIVIIKKINDDAGTNFTQSYSEETYEYFVNNRANLPIVEFNEIAFLQ